MKTNKLVVTGVLLILVGAFVSYYWVYLQFNPNLMKDATNLLVKYGIIIIAIERAVQVYIGIKYEPDKKVIKTAITSNESSMTLLYKQVDRNVVPEHDKQQITGELKGLKGANDVLQKELIVHKNNIQRAAVKLVFILGIIMAIAGVSILNDIVIYPPELDICADGNFLCKFQKYILRAMDIFITGGLIGGGSKGYHEFISGVADYLKQYKKEIAA